MTQCSFCDKSSHSNCYKCNRPVCRSHSHYKDFTPENNYTAAMAGNEYHYELYCKSCDDNFLAFDWLKYVIALVLMTGVFLSMIIGFTWWFWL
ncbi:MAG: hypothetical protein FK733_16765 [Asgard group archaeon]|nr:hypothetical protein [Asgard group archaeon]